MNDPMTPIEAQLILDYAEHPRGFMDPARHHELAAAGGRRGHELGVAHEFTPEQARIAGRLGGLKVSQNRAHMAAIGHKGGLAASADHRRMAEIGRRGGLASAARRMERR